MGFRTAKKSVLNLASPELDSTDVRRQHGACKSSTLTSIYSQSRETAAKSISQPKRDFKKVILSHDLFILFLHGTKLSDSYAEPREGGEIKNQNRKKTLRPKSQEPCWGQGNGLVVFEGCLKPSK